MSTKRVIYFDLLKVLSAFAVVLIHVISQYWYNLNVNSFNFTFLTLIDSLLRFCVPIYFMISGALFLNEEKEITIKQIFSKYIFRILIIYIFWNLVYALGTNIFLDKNPLTLNIVLESVKNTLLGHSEYHLLFLVLIISFYLCVPILKKNNKKRKQTRIEIFYNITIYIY